MNSRCARGVDADSATQSLGGSGLEVGKKVNNGLKRWGIPVPHASFRSFAEPQAGLDTAPADSKIGMHSRLCQPVAGNLFANVHPAFNILFHTSVFRGIFDRAKTEVPQISW